MLRAVNAGSGQRPFQSEEGVIQWINVDKQERWNPDVIADCANMGMFQSGQFDYVVSHHVIEHWGCNDAIPFIREAYRVLKPGGSLLVFVPDLRALAQKWLMRQMDTETYVINLYGAFMGDDADRHKFGYDGESLHRLLKVNAGVPWKDVHAFNWRPIPNADLARDFWVLSQECIK